MRAAGGGDGSDPTTSDRRPPAHAALRGRWAGGQHVVADHQCAPPRRRRAAEAVVRAAIDPARLAARRASRPAWSATGTQAQQPPGHAARPGARRSDAACRGDRLHRVVTPSRTARAATGRAPAQRRTGREPRRQRRPRAARQRTTSANSRCSLCASTIARSVRRSPAAHGREPGRHRIGTRHRPRQLAAHGHSSRPGSPHPTQAPPSNRSSAPSRTVSVIPPVHRTGSTSEEARANAVDNEAKRPPVEAGRDSPKGVRARRPTTREGGSEGRADRTGAGRAR